MLSIVAVSAGAAPLNLDHLDPDITATELSTLSYNHSNQTLTINNASTSLLSLTYTLPDGSAGPPAFNGTWTLEANIGNNGILDPNGSTLTIINTEDVAGIPSGSTLLAGNLTDFGYQFASTTVLLRTEFLLDITQSEPSLGFAGRAGVILTPAFITAIADISTPFQSSFSLVGTAPDSDTFHQNAPLPTSLSLMGLALLLLLRGRQRFSSTARPTAA